MAALPTMLVGLGDGLIPVAALASLLINLWLTPYMTLCDLAYFEEGQMRLGRPPYGGAFHAL